MQASLLALQIGRVRHIPGLPLSKRSARPQTDPACRNLSPKKTVSFTLFKISNHTPLEAWSQSSVLESQHCPTCAVSRQYIMNPYDKVAPLSATPISEQLDRSTPIAHTVTSGINPPSEQQRKPYHVSTHIFPPIGPSATYPALAPSNPSQEQPFKHSINSFTESRAPRNTTNFGRFLSLRDHPIIKSLT